MFEDFSMKEVTLIKHNETKMVKFNAVVQPGLIITPDVAIRCEINDVIIEILPSGIQNRYLIKNVDYYESMGSIPANYQIKVINEKNTLDNKAHVMNIVNSSGVVVNQNSQLNDVSIALNNEGSTDVFLALIKVISETSISNKEEVINCVKEMKDSKGTPEFKDKFFKFISLTAEITTIVSPYLTNLVNL